MVEAQSQHLSINIWVPSSLKSTFRVRCHRQMVCARMAGGRARCFASPAFFSILAALVSKAAPVLWCRLLQGQGWGAGEPAARRGSCLAGEPGSSAFLSWCNCLCVDTGTEQKTLKGVPVTPMRACLAGGCGLCPTQLSGQIGQRLSIEDVICVSEHVGLGGGLGNMIPRESIDAAFILSFSRYVDWSALSANDVWRLMLGCQGPHMLSNLAPGFAHLAVWFMFVCCRQV